MALPKMRVKATRRPDVYLPGFPFEDGLTEGRVMSGEQLSVSLYILDMTQKDLARISNSSEAAVSQWASNIYRMPMLVSDWLRLRVAQRMRAMAAGTGTPVMLESDYEKAPSEQAKYAIKALWQIVKEREQAKREHQPQTKETET